MRRKLSFALLGLLGLPACGLLLKDYHIDDSQLETAVCELGDHRCSADWLLRCNDTLQGYTRADTCAAAELCDPDRGVCRACRPFEVRCDAARLESCRADGSGWALAEECGGPEQCNVALAACAPCTPGEFQCNQGALSQCKADGNWGAPTQCGAAELCRVADDRKSGSCQPSAGCSANGYACSERNLTRCDARGALTHTIETCASAELCQAALRTPPEPDSVPKCVAPTCGSGAFRCDGAQLFVCAEDRSAWKALKTCSSDAPCNPKMGDCVRCSPGTFACEEADLLVCDDNGVFQPSATCAAPVLCDAAAGTCQAAECDTPGSSFCDEEVPVLHTCGSDYKSQRKTCNTNALCSAAGARCRDPVCARGAQRCAQGNFQRCNDEQTAWQTVLSCSNPSDCDPDTGACVSTPCQAGAHRCNDVFLETCSDGSWERSLRCATAGLCDATAGACLPPLCAEGTFQCMDIYLMRCTTSRTWEDIGTCDSAAQCDAMRGRCL